MHATDLPGDKFAFLFRTGAGYDLSTVKTVLDTRYKYNIWEHSTSVGTFQIEGADFIQEFKLFAQAVEAHIATGTTINGTSALNTVIIFIAGDADATGLIGSAFDGSTLGWDTVKDVLSGNFGPSSYDYLAGSEVHIVFLTDYCFEIKSRFDFADKGSLLVPLTNASIMVDTHASFIASWVNIVGLADLSVCNSQGFLTFESIASTIHSANINAANPLVTWFTEFYGGAEITTVDENEATWKPFYIGLPKLVIRDGSPSWWNSPDIWVTNTIFTNEGNQYYEAGESNDIHTRVFNQGCHPLTRFYLGVTLFPFGGGGTPGEPNPTPRLIDSITVEVGDSYHHSYPWDFISPLGHRCLKARASFTDILTADIEDDTDWSPTIYDYEAQKNLNPADISGTGGGAGDAGEDAVPEPEPGDDAGGDDGADAGAEEKSISNLRDKRMEEILIMNPYREKRRFRIVLPEELKKYRDILDIRLFTFNSRSPEKIFPFETRKSKFPRATFTLLPGQEISLLAFCGLKKGVKEVKTIELPLEILVESKKSDNFFRSPVIRGFKERFSSFAGVTLRIMSSSVSLRFMVTDSKKNPVKGARVYLSTPNGRQSAIVRTDAKGMAQFSTINPGYYYARAIGLKSKSDRIIINGYPGRKITAPHSLVLKDR